MIQGSAARQPAHDRVLAAALVERVATNRLLSQDPHRTRPYALSSGGACANYSNLYGFAKRAKKPPERMGPRGAKDAILFRERLDA